MPGHQTGAGDFAGLEGRRRDLQWVPTADSFRDKATDPPTGSRLSNNSSAIHSTWRASRVRKGNPKNIHDWSDLVRSDVKPLFPKPENLRHTYLAAWARRITRTAAIKPKPNSLYPSSGKTSKCLILAVAALRLPFAERGLGDVLD